MNREICNLMHRFLDEMEPISDREIDIIANHLKDCKRCSTQAMAFIMVMQGECL